MLENNVSNYTEKQQLNAKLKILRKIVAIVYILNMLISRLFGGIDTVQQFYEHNYAESNTISHTYITNDVYQTDLPTILAESEEAGFFLAIADEGRKIFVMGHPEYDRLTLDKEYKRDKSKGLSIDLPVNYYPNDDENEKPLLQWRSHGNILYANWLNYYVYQETPYEFINTGKIVGK